MCEINPAHKKFFRLEAFSSDTKLSRADFERIVYKMIVEAETKLNESNKIRFHVHESEGEGGDG